MHDSNALDSQFPAEKFHVTALDSSNITGCLCDKHSHDFFEVLFILYGSVEYTIDGIADHAGKGSIVLVDCGVIHEVMPMANTDFHAVLLLFSSKFLDIISGQTLNFYLRNVFTPQKNVNPVLDLNLFEDQDVGELISKIVNERNHIDKTIIKLLLMQLIVMLDRLLRKTAAKENTPFDEISKKIREVEDYINENYAMPLSLDMLASQFFLSKYYLSHSFKKVTGYGVLEFINQKRLLEAEVLLKYSKHGITEIAYKIGYNSDSHFIRMFKQAKNMTPKEYRSIYLENSQMALNIT